MKPKSFILFLFAGAILMALLCFWPLYTYSGIQMAKISTVLILWTSFLTSLSYTLIFPSLKASGIVFMNRLLLITMLRLLVSIALVLVLWFLFPEQVFALVILYFFYYVCGLTFEILVLLRNLRKISK